MLTKVNILVVLLVRLVLLHDLLLLLLKTTGVVASMTFSLIEGSLLVEACVGSSLEAELSSLHVHDFDLLAHIGRHDILHVAWCNNGSVIIVCVVVINHGAPLGPVRHAEHPLKGVLIVAEELSLGEVIGFFGVAYALLGESLPEEALEFGRRLVARR